METSSGGPHKDSVDWMNDILSPVATFLLTGAALWSMGLLRFTSIANEKPDPTAAKAPAEPGGNTSRSR